MHPSPSLSCPSGLYPPSSPLAPLNTPLYVATDAHFPRKDELLELFRNTFPCIFFLGDFKETNSINDARVEPLGFMETSVDKQGEPLGRFLEPFVEAEVVAKAKIAVGSTSYLFLPTFIIMMWLRSRDETDWGGGGLSCSARVDVLRVRDDDVVPGVPFLGPMRTPDFLGRRVGGVYIQVRPTCSSTRTVVLTLLDFPCRIR